MTLQKKLRKLLYSRANKTPGFPLRPVATSKSGVTYYTFERPEMLPVNRFYELEQAKRMFQMRVTREVLEDRLNKCIEAMDKGKFVEAGQPILELKTRLELYAERKSMLRIACVFFVAEDEDINVMSELAQERKIADWAADSELEAFFLQQVWNMMHPSQQLSVTALAGYLNQIEGMMHEIQTTPPLPKPTSKSQPKSRPTSTASMNSTTQSRTASTPKSHFSKGSQ